MAARRRDPPPQPRRCHPPQLRSPHTRFGSALTHSLPFSAACTRARLARSSLPAGPGLGENDVEGKVFKELELFLAEGRPIARALDLLYDELKMEDLRQV